MASKCNMFLDPSGFSCEDISSPFDIPRTSSIAKSKRPSVSFAEGTRFSPKERRGSAHEPAAQAGPSRSKAKPSSAGSAAPAPQDQGEAARTAEEDETDGKEREGKTPGGGEACGEPADDGEPRATLQSRCGSERRRANSNSPAPRGSQRSSSEATAGSAEKVTTVYVTVGKAGRAGWRAELNTEGPVQAVLRRLGSLQRQREQQNSGKNRPKAANGMSKPPRKKLGARASVWEQGGPSRTEVSPCKPTRRKQADQPPSDGGAARRPLSSILKSVPEAAPAHTGSDPRTEGAANQNQGGESASGKVESSYLTIGPAGEAGRITEVIANEGAEPCYENVMIQHS